MASLLVSVRNADEASLALEGGAQLIDVKEPAHGPLGFAGWEVLSAVLDRLPAGFPASAALGELRDWPPLIPAAAPPPAVQARLSYAKLGLSGLGASSEWPRKFSRLRLALGLDAGWIAVAYTDWRTCGAPDPSSVLRLAVDLQLAGVLVDSYDKLAPGALDLTWAPWVKRARDAGLLVSLAGRLDEDAIDSLQPLEPDFFAVRGAACAGGDRVGKMDLGRVRTLALACSAPPKAIALDERTGKSHPM